MESDSKFSLSSLFSKSGSTATKKKSKLPPHPSEREHRSPLNSLDPTYRPVPPASGDVLLPVHPTVRSGRLPNGLSYCILPNASPAGRFEAHLQVFSGSSDELDAQQGIAHLTEHVAYMGSRKRERLFGTGSQTNAYTDFHHTVFYAACPLKTPQGGAPMLPMALDALVDVMEARVESSRLEKERAAVLSEMTMVNTIEYRVECQILSTLHRENRLAKRFPIGKEILIRNWDTAAVKTWHRTHYRPDNVLLYVVGDVASEDVEKVIAQKFSHITAEKQAVDISEEVKPEASLLADATVSGTVKSELSWHYPPIVHDWSMDKNSQEETKAQAQSHPDQEYDGQLQQFMSMDEKVEFLETVELGAGKKIRPHIFRHELLQAFSLHLFAKRPVVPITTLSALRGFLARRVALAALQIRLNVSGRSENPPFTFVEFNQLDSAREGCAVCSIDMTGDPLRWREAVTRSISEVRKLGVYGVTQNEFERYASALLTDADQLAAQGDRIGHGDQLAHLMETVANGHTLMSPEQSLDMTLGALQLMTLEEVNEEARQLCSHILGFHEGEEGVDGTVAAVACSPKQDGEDCTEEALVKCIYDACQMDVEPEKDVVVPHTLVDTTNFSLDEVKWQDGVFQDGTPNTPSDLMSSPFTLRRLNNGIRVAIGKNTAESQRGHLRLVAPGGRDAEAALGLKLGSMQVGARTMQEGGAFGPWTREQVELFCVDHLIMVEINCSEENIIFDFVFPTNNVGNTGFGDDISLGITGTEAVLQIAREIVAGFQWEDDALRRAKNNFNVMHDGLNKNLEQLTTEKIMEGVTAKDKRFLSMDVDTVESVTLEDAKQAVMSQLIPERLDISIVGDFDPEEILEQVRSYIGSIPKDINDKYRKQEILPTATMPQMPLPGKFILLELADSDPRAVAYVSGSAPNVWGYMADGTTVSQRLLSGKKLSENDKRRRSHPFFANAALMLLSEIINRRLFSTVRERRQLTYDANFSLTGFERLMGGYFLVTVTASKEKAQLALDACKETLEALRTSNPVSPDNLESARRVVLHRHQTELRTSRYWTELLSGMQEESIPLKGPYSFTEFEPMVEAITARDLQETLECMGVAEEELYTAIGQTTQVESRDDEETDGLVREVPVVGMRRGGALRG